MSNLNHYSLQEAIQRSERIDLIYDDIDVHRVREVRHMARLVGDDLVVGALSLIYASQLATQHMLEGIVQGDAHISVVKKAPVKVEATTEADLTLTAEQAQLARHLWYAAVDRILPDQQSCPSEWLVALQLLDDVLPLLKETS
jgi:hypothetical protein